MVEFRTCPKRKGHNMKITELPESPGRNLLMRLEYLDQRPGGKALNEYYRHARNPSAYYLVLLAGYVVEQVGDSNKEIPISSVNEYFWALRERFGDDRGTATDRTEGKT